MSTITHRSNIYISHHKDCAKDWCPFKIKPNKDIKKIVEDAWDKYIKGSPHYLKFTSTVGCELCVAPEYPLPNIRPLRSEEFEYYYGCLFDLDAYDKKEDYLVKEVESLPSTVFAGAVSNLMNFTSEPKVESLFKMPIYDEEVVKRYLLLLLILIRAANDANFATATDEITIKEREILKMEYQKRSCEGGK